VVPRNYYSQLSDATNRTLLEVGMVEDRGWLPIREQLAYKYALSVDGNTASTRLAMLLASDQVGCCCIAASHLSSVNPVPCCRAQRARGSSSEQAGQGKLSTPCGMYSSITTA